MTLARATRDFPGLTVVVGFADRETGSLQCRGDSARRRRAGVYHKHFLPTYRVFDEDRYFSAGVAARRSFVINGVTAGINICEDIWYPDGPPTVQAYAGAELLLNISASPFYVGKQVARERMLATRAADTGAIVAYVNLVGGQDELVFDGASVIFDEQGELLGAARMFEEDLLMLDLDVEGVFRTRLHDPRRRKERPFAPDAAQEQQRQAILPRADPRDRARRHNPAAAYLAGSAWAGRAHRAAAAAGGAGVSRTGAGDARLCAQERLSGRGDRALRRH